MIEVRRRHWKSQTYPLNFYEQPVRDAYFKRLRWEQWRDRQIAVLRDAFIAKCDVRKRTEPRSAGDSRPEWEFCLAPSGSGMGGVPYRYFHWMWTHMHPFFEWPEHWADQSDRLAWLHRQYALKTGKIAPYSWGSRQWCGSPIDPSVLSWASGALLSSLILVGGGKSGKGDGTGGGLPVAGAFAVDVQNLSGNASDSNNGVWDDGGINGGPWATWGELETQAEAGIFSVGDHIYLRAGTYSPTGHTNWTGGGTTLNSSKITVESWPGETGNIDWTTVDDTSLHGTNPISSIAGPLTTDGNWRWKSVQTTCYQQCWSTNGSSAPGCEWIGCTRSSSGSTTGGGNIAVISMIDNSSDWLIEGCNFEASQLSSGNTATAVYYILTTNGVIRNNFFLGDDEANPIYNKRTSPSVTMTISNNYLDMRSTTKALVCDQVHTDQHTFQNNIMVAAAGSFIFNWGTNAAGIGTTYGWGCYNNDILHNTFYGTHANPSVVQLTDSNSGGSAGLDNVVRDNAFANVRFVIDQNQNPIYNHQTDSDYNLYDSSLNGGNHLQEGNTSYDLTGWRAEDTRFLNNTHDDNSAAESGIDFASTPVVGTISSFALAGTSAGSGTASDATDMGADTSLVGPSAIGY